MEPLGQSTSKQAVFGSIGKHALTKMTADQFEVLAQLTRAREPAKTAARMVLVEGLIPADVARELEMSPQSVSNTVGRYREFDASVRAAYRVKKGFL